MMVKRQLPCLVFATMAIGLAYPVACVFEAGRVAGREKEVRTEKLILFNDGREVAFSVGRGGDLRIQRDGGALGIQVRRGAVEFSVADSVVELRKLEDGTAELSLRGEESAARSVMRSGASRAVLAFEGGKGESVELRCDDGGFSGLEVRGADVHMELGASGSFAGLRCGRTAEDGNSAIATLGLGGGDLLPELRLVRGGSPGSFAELVISEDDSRFRLRGGVSYVEGVAGNESGELAVGRVGSTFARLSAREESAGVDLAAGAGADQVNVSMLLGKESLRSTIAAAGKPVAHLLQELIGETGTVWTKLTRMSRDGEEVVRGIAVSDSGEVRLGPEK